MEGVSMIEEDQTLLVTVPSDNLEGYRRARSQLHRIRDPGWTINYDRGDDTLYLRAPHAGPAVSYFHPNCSDILFRLDASSGELTGIDLERFRAVLVKAEPTLSDLSTGLRVARALHALPPLRGLQRLLDRALPVSAGDDLIEFTSRTSPA